MTDEHETLWQLLVNDRGRTLTIENCFAISFAVSKIAHFEAEIASLKKERTGQRELNKPSTEGNR